MKASAKFSFNSKPTDLPTGVESAFITTSDEQQLEVWNLPSSKENIGRKSVAIILNGNGGVLHGLTHLMEWFKEMGISSYAFDYRGFGRSTGWPSERGLYIDSNAVWDYIKNRERIDSSQLIVLGISLGGAPAAELASRHQPKVLVLLSAFSSLPEVIELTPFYKYLKALVWYIFPTKEFVAKLKSTCFISAHGERDSVVPFSLQERLINSYKGEIPPIRLISSSADHDDIFERVKPQLKNAIQDCLNR